ncbi:terminase TerL endonuclease subunit [Luteipulveratus halotolerans]|uniref:Terminase n=1 Tax=Luteipulveratus halotolerans TaxID=1631356 RepID=A0A0L6CJY1_9MICO|nr:terminase TerL endonuclease subunit [Luteipulveratus halotolerans]KNX38092.1 terminase [Luteipulveratus halotolerans]
MTWLEPPPAGTPVCGGFDGSTVDDATVIKLETRGGHLFTPRYGPDRRPTIWLPAEWGGTVPRLEVHAAWDEIARTYQLRRVYCDPWQWQTEIERWDEQHGPDTFLVWDTKRARPMHEALDRMVTDLASGAVTHDGCPITTLHVNNARKLAKPNETYQLGKPAQHQKIDAAVTSTICHEAASDARAEGWDDTDTRVFCFT